ncbi:MAG: tRNA (adenosine(37)-N6)-threonylcarbamoyltransferase complex dimerization subunit type 1 TsaB [Bacteroidales bacterium]|nr:tRNA (adenosine(37)-N6)-threonylcarbamoyltransferase complex dimerization subunit type 1 TsaB [Bacteroidales bacterium]
MANIIHIDTSTDICSVALSQEGLCIFNREDHEGPNHARVLAPMVEEAIGLADSRGVKLDAVSVSAGPGSYTGLRIGVSTAKGLCYGLNLNLIGVQTLELLCVPILLEHEEIPEDSLLCPMLDARRMEVYTALYDRALRPANEVTPVIVEDSSFCDVLKERPVVFFGNGAAKCKDIIKHDNAIFIDGIEPLAKNMLPLADKAIAQGKTEDVAYFEPFYLKDFIAGTSKKLF